MEKIIDAKAADLEKLGLTDASVRFHFVVEDGLFIGLHQADH